MGIWTWLGLGAVVVLVVPPVALRLLVALARRYGTDPTPMRSVVYTYPGFAPGLRDRAAAKRRQADALRQQLARTESQPAVIDRGEKVRRFGG